MDLEFGGKGVKKEKPSIETKMLAWPECLYREKDEKIRFQLLEEAERQELQMKETKIRRYLLDHRYEKPNREGKRPDHYMRLWLELAFAYECVRKGRLSGSSEKKINKALELCGLKDYDFGDSGRMILYQEFYHMAVLYINLCLEDKQYKSIILGLGHMNSEKLSKKIARDVIKVGYFVPEFVKFPNYEIWEKAVMDAYGDFYPDNDEYVEALKNNEIMM